jgi:hypothetical protein
MSPTKSGQMRFARTFVLSSNLPFGVSTMMDGGRNGYSAGKTMRKWYSPPSNSVPDGPRSVQCHSYTTLVQVTGKEWTSSYKDIVLKALSQNQDY